MKIRTDFVTNSSSSSFVLVFKNEAEMEKCMRDIGQRYGKKYEEVVTRDVQRGKRNRAGIRRCFEKYYNREAIYKYVYGSKEFKEHTKTTGELREMPEIRNAIKEYKITKTEQAMKNIPYKAFYTEVKYADDNGPFYSELEHNIIPSLPATVLVISNH